VTLMATAATAYGERRFGAAYSLRILVTLGVLGLLVGLWAAVVALWVVLGKTALTVNDFGVRRESVLGQQEMAWSQIAETRFRVVPINTYAHFGLIGALLAMSSKSRRALFTLELISADGKKLKITSAFRNADEAIGIILARILPAMVENVKAKLRRGETMDFGGIRLSATAVNWKNTSIPVSEITKAELAGICLKVKRQGKWLAAISVKSDKVPNVLVFLEVLESLAPQIKSTGIDPLARVRV
jgi:hypothetical protein